MADGKRAGMGMAGALAGAVVAWLFAGAVPGSFAMGSREPEAMDGRVHVQYWEKWTDFEGEAMQAVVDDFNASQDRIFVEKLTVSEIDRKMMLATAGGNPPDVVGLWSFNVNVYAEKGALQPIDKYLAAAGITSNDYTPVFWNLCRHRGFTWALPTTPATVALHWNKKLFRDAGLDPDKPPKSMAELEEMADKMTVVDIVRNGEKTRVRYTELTPEEKEAKTFKLIQLGFTPQEPGWWNHSWIYWFGGRHWDGDRTVTANSPENLETARWYGHFSKKFGLDNLRAFGSSFGNFSSPQNAFLAGKVAMEVQGVWMYNFISKFAPQLEWAAAPFPSVDPEKLPNVTIAECDLLVIPKGARHPDEAFEFIRFVNTQASLEKLNMGQRKFSPRATVSDEFVRNHPNPYIGMFIELAKSPNALTVPRIPIWNEYGDEQNVAYSRIFDQIMEPEEALGIVQERLQQKLDRYMRRWDRIKDERIKEWSER
jgi:multiple sugar transport system substrate-binding protein